MVVEGLAGAEPPRRRAQPGPRASARRRPGAKAAVWGAHRQRAPGHHRRRLGRPGRGRGSCCSGRCVQEPLSARRPELSTSCSPSWSRCFLWAGATAAMASARGSARGCPHLVARDLARRTLAVPDDLPLSEAVRRAQEAQAGSIVTVTGSGQPGRRGQRGRRCWPPPRSAGRGCAVSTVARALDDGLPLPATHHAARTWSAPSPARRRRSTSCVEEDGSIYGVLATADVDRAFRERPRLAVPPAMSDASRMPDAVAHPARTRRPARGLVRRAPRPAARGRVGAADRPARAAGTTSAWSPASASSPTGATSTTTT